ncbi:MAG: 4-hydroxy-3-methylbut-2-enyl diphosphate reductase [Candidatus Alcyoniella australis]|nr:4-hydroxy-3-methylbut-2-enyl diphosphate reductase [Candidatus Alcyoniella australis]
MEIILARTAGFCMGVRRAVDMVLEAVRPGAGQMATVGPLVHNPQVVELLELRNVLCAADAAQIQGGTAVIRSHGIGPRQEQELRERGLRILDATCPKVKAVHKVIAKQAAEGKHVIILGDRDHPEVRALLGYAGGRGLVIGGPQELPDPLPEPVCLVAQTTQDPELFREVVDRARELATGEPEVRNTICDATRARQKEVRELAAKVDLLLVVGGSNSGNTSRLTQIGRGIVRTVQIEQPQQVDELDLEGVQRLGITAGASTPSWVIEQVVQRLGERAAYAEATGLRRLSLYLFAGLRGLVLAGLSSALAAAALAAFFLLAVDRALYLPALLVPALFVMFIHLLNRLTDFAADRYRDEPQRQRFMRRYRLALWPLCLAAGVGSAFAATALGAVPALIVLVSALLGFVYSVPLLPKVAATRLGAARLKDLAASKNVSVALGWTIITAGPIAWYARPAAAPCLAATLALLAATWLRSLLFDLADFASDRLAGRESVPTIFGIDASVRAARLAALGLGLWLICCALLGWLPWAAGLIGALVGIEALLMRLPRKVNGIWTQALIEAHFLLAVLLMAIVQ